jgi:putative hydrolase of the HAD superfamily
VTRTKPSPDLYLSACEGLKVAPSEAIAFEDSLNGLRAAKGAGLYSVATPNSITAHLPLEPEADLLLPSLADLSLPDLLDRASSRSDRSDAHFLHSLAPSV